MSNITTTKTANAVDTIGTAFRSRNPRNMHRAVAAIVFRLMAARYGIEEAAEYMRFTRALAYEDETAAVAESERDWTECRCKVHEPKECGVDGAVGCRGKAYGSHPAIRALYEGGHRACVLEPGVAVRDKALFELAEFGRGRSGAVRARFCKGYGTSSQRLGAYYCYTHFFPESVVMRIARILGPEPKVERVVRYALFVGKSSVESFEMQRVSTSVVHVAKVPGRALKLYEALGLLVDFCGYEARVGTDPALAANDAQASIRAMVAAAKGRAAGSQTGCVVEWCAEAGPPMVSIMGCVGDAGLGVERGDKLMSWLAEHGVAVSGELRVPALLATTAMAACPEFVPGVKERNKLWALHGDTVSRAVVTRMVAEADRGIADAVGMMRRLENVALAGVYQSSGLSSVCNAGSLLIGSKATADIVEALVGVVDLYCGQESSAALVRSLVLSGERMERVRERRTVVVVRRGIALTQRQLDLAEELAALGLLD